ncbi:MAG: hypothetical protein WCI53_12715 [Bacteroidota bacterium]
MTNTEIAEWVANEFLSYKLSYPDKGEETIVKFILTIRYKSENASNDFNEIATSNLPFVKTFFDLLVTLINIEADDGRTKELEMLIFGATLHLRKLGYVEKIDSEDFTLVNSCLTNIIKYVILKVKEKEEQPMHFFMNFKTLIIRQMYKTYKSYNEIEAFLDMVY